LALDVCTPSSTQKPRIVKLTMPGMSDLEVTMLTASITITPGTLVLGVADATDDQPRACYVQALFCGDETAVMADLERMRYKVAAANRGPAAVPVELGGAA
jgi:multicomponent Na+:H+ antiporter subunit E